MKRRGIFIATAVVLVLVLVVVAVALGVTLSRSKQTFRETFTARCQQLKGSDCERIWSTFEKAYVNQNPCKVPPDAYNDLFDLVPMKTMCNKVMFWSGTKDVVHDFNRKKTCFVTMEDTLLGSMLDGLTWCGKESSNETLTSGCPGWAEPNCEDNPVRSFWAKGSARFAEAACGDTSVMLSGSISSPFTNSSIFGSIELPKLNPDKVRKLTVVLVTPDHPKATCSDGSLNNLQRALSSGISYECKEVPETRIKECGSNPDISCTSCW